MKKLGDSHNFGRFVYEDNGYIVKPRSLYWEFLFLSKESPLRTLINNRSIELGISSPFRIAPHLNFKTFEGKIDRVEKIELVILPDCFRFNQKDLKSIGSLIALCFWFGLGDLHKDNLICGLNDKSEFIFFPIDIECIFDKQTHIQQTLLVPSEVVPQNNCGLALIWNKLFEAEDSNKISIIQSFLEFINLLNSMHEEIFDVLLEESKLNESEIRVIPRATKKYCESIQLGSMENYFASEIIQMKRGEIPYFFRFPKNSILYYYHSLGVLEYAGFDIEAFKLPSLVKVDKKNSNQLVKIKTAILSMNYFAEILNMKTKTVKLGNVDIMDRNRVFSIYEQDGKILFKYT